ncbi:hypothetical protein HYW20_05475 [Candidatus Woesearchaeota archaeon]|nr:hypothetical protein [Candidatus Woesearchaeota archaeon]
MSQERSVFLEREGHNPKNKVLDFLIVAQDFDYSLKEIAKHSNVSYPCIKQLKKELVKNKWINLTRKVGKAQMYKLNIKNPMVKKFMDYYWAVVESAVEEELGIKSKAKAHEEGYKSVVPLAVSAKHV